MSPRKVCFVVIKGGLDITYLAGENEALLLKFLHKFFNNENIHWVHLIWKSYNSSTPQASNISSSFWWRDIIKLCSKFNSIASCLSSSGDNAQIIQWQSSPCFTPPYPLDKLASVKNILELNEPFDVFHLLCLLKFLRTSMSSITL